MYLFVAEITLRRFGFDYLIKSLGQIVQSGIAVYIGLYGCKHLTVAADFKGRTLQRHLGVLVVLIDLDARSRCVLKGQLDVLAVVPCKGLNVRTIGSVTLRCGDLVYLERAGRQVAALYCDFSECVRSEAVFIIAVNASNFKGGAHQIAAIRTADFVDFECMVSAVCKLQFDGLTAFRAGVDRLCREQRVAFRCGGFFYRNVGIQRQIVKNHLARRGRNAGQRCFLSGVGQLKGTACQSRTGFIGFQDTHTNRALCDLLIDEKKLRGGLLDRRFDQNDRLNTAGVGRCNINIIAVYIHRRGNSSLQLGVCRVHLFGGRFRDTQQKGFAVSHIVAVFVQRFVIPHITQRQCAVCAFHAGFAHQKCADRQFIGFERDFIAAYKRSGSRRHRQDQTGLSVNLFFCEHAGFDNAASQID